MFEDKFKGIPTGFLGLRARLTQSWLAPPLLVLIIYIVKLLLLQRIIEVFLDLSFMSVKAECKAAKSVVNTALDAQAQSIILANKMVNKSVKSTIDAAIDSLKLTMTVAEKLIMFALEMTIGTYACLSVSAINIAAGEAINGTEAVVNFTSHHIKAIGEDLNSGLNDVSKYLNTAVGLLMNIEDFVTGGDKKIQSVNLTISKLNNLSIPTSINSNLEKIRNDVPTYDTTKKKVASLIDAPFDMIKGKLNSTNFTTTIKMDNPYQNLSRNFQGCNFTEINDGFDIVKSKINTLTNILCALCAVAIAVSIVYQIWSTTRHWRFMEATAAEQPDQVLKDDMLRPEVVNMNRISLAESNFFGRFAFKHFNNEIRWIFEYLSRPPVATFLLIGIAGLILSGMEYAVLKLMISGADEIKKIAGSTTNNLKSNLNNMTDSWETTTNNQINGIETDINQNMLGWLYNGSLQLNNTLNTLMDSIDGEITDIFNNTFLMKPLQAAVQCVIGNKVDTVEEGLTWVHNKSRVDLPRVSKALLPKDASNVTEQADSNFDNILHSGIQSIYHQIKVQFIVSAIFIAVWILFALGVYIFYSWHHKPERFVSRMNVFRNRSHRVSDVKSSDDTSMLKVEQNTYSEYPKSPIGHISARLSQFFTGPERLPEINEVFPKHFSKHGSIHNPDSPRTPLKAMLHKHLYLD